MTWMIRLLGWICRIVVFYLMSFLVWNNQLSGQGKVCWYVAGAIATFIGLVAIGRTTMKEEPLTESERQMARVIYQRRGMEYDASNPFTGLRALLFAAIWPIASWAVFGLCTFIEVWMLFWSPLPKTS